jgi:endonuclease/exonuclease/phosphatase family metal-dependent hydrolase
MGDFNMGPQALATQLLIQAKPLVIANPTALTFPSWRPKRLLDYILVSPSFKISQVNVLALPYSDHLPVGVELIVPSGIHLETYV